MVAPQCWPAIEADSAAGVYAERQDDAATKIATLGSPCHRTRKRRIGWKEEGSRLVRRAEPRKRTPQVAAVSCASLAHEQMTALHAARGQADESASGSVMRESDAYHGCTRGWEEKAAASAS